jgi:hypothetical protein
MISSVVGRPARNEITSRRKLHVANLKLPLFLGQLCPFRNGTTRPSERTCPCTGGNTFFGMRCSTNVTDARERRPYQIGCRGWMRCATKTAPCCPRFAPSPILHSSFLLLPFLPPLFPMRSPISHSSFFILHSAFPAGGSPLPLLVSSAGSPPRSIPSETVPRPARTLPRRSRGRR